MFAVNMRGRVKADLLVKENDHYLIAAKDILCDIIGTFLSHELGLLCIDMN